MTSKTVYYKDPDAKRLVDTLASAVRAEMKQRHLIPYAVSKEVSVGLSTLYGLFGCRRVSLDTFVALARWAGYDVALTPRADT